MTEKRWPDLRASLAAWEDEAVLLIDKPVGISVMGERHDTDLVRLAQESGERLFPVHRIDKVTSGAVLLAKDLAVHAGLTRQFNKQTVDKAYLVVTRTVGLPERGVIELPLSAGRKGRIRIAAPRESIRFDPTRGRWSVAEADILDTRVYPSTTRVTALWSDGVHSLLLAQPVTGRRHQIRVHLAWIGHPILGDPLFDKSAHTAGLRTFLHSWRLGVRADWRGDERLDLEVPPGPDFWEPLAPGMGGPARAEVLQQGREHLRAGSVTRPTGSASPRRPARR